MLAALDALIANGTGGRRVVVLKQVCGLFLRTGFDGADDTASLFDELMATLAMDLDEETLQVLAPELRRMPGVLPAFTSTVMSRFHEIASRNAEVLATEPERFEAEMRLESPAPPEPDVPVEREATLAAGDRSQLPVAPFDAVDALAFARQASPAQLLAIARLPQLPEVLSGIIMSRGDMEAIAALLANPGAAFTRSCLLAAAELAAGDRRVKEALLTRADLPENVVMRLLPVVGREARARLVMSGTRPDPEQARKALADSQVHLAADAARGMPRPTIDALRREMADDHLTPTEVITSLAAARRLPELAALATAELTIELDLAHAMLSARLDQPGAIIVRAMGGTLSAVEAILDMRHGLDLRPTKDARGAEQMCEQWSQEEARVMLRLIARNLAAAAEADAERDQSSDTPLALAG